MAHENTEKVWDLMAAGGELWNRAGANANEPATEIVKLVRSGNACTEIWILGKLADRPTVEMLAKACRDVLEAMDSNDHKEG